MHSCKTMYLTKSSLKAFLFSIDYTGEILEPVG